MRHQGLEAQEQTRLKAIETRRGRMDAIEEPADSVPLKLQFPNGLVRTRKFLLSESIQTLFDFAGQEEMASEVFCLRDIASNKVLESTLLGSIDYYNIKEFSTLYVQWMATLPVQKIDASEPNGAFPAVGQHSPSPTPSPPHRSPAPSPPHWSPAPSPPIQPTLRTLEDSESSSTEINLQTVLMKLLSKVDLTSNRTSNQINVCRDNILQDSLQAFKRRRFDPGAKLDVIFVDSEGTGEGAVDDGGPTREYLRLLMKAIQHSKIFDGPENDRLLALDTHGLETGLYMLIGKMVTVCIIHGGVGPHFFSERLFLQLCGKSPPPASLEEVGDRSFREKLLKMKGAESVHEANDAEDSLSMMGTLRYISSLEQRDSLVQSAADYFVDGRMHVALTQFEEGFKTLGFLDELRAHPEIFEDLFTNELKPLEAKDLSTLFEVDFSAPGSNRRRLENQIICFWRDWLIDVEEGECSPLTLEMVLEFTSGASAVPPLGFPLRPVIEFLHDEDTKIFPEANTCVIVLRLPIHKQYEKFRSCMTEGILQAPSFGIA